MKLFGVQKKISRWFSRELRSSFSCAQQVLLLNADPTIVNERNYKGNTPLHIAAGFSTAVDLEKQKEICRLLVGAGGLANIQNNEGKTPLALVSLERKEIIKKILHKKL